MKAFNPSRCALVLLCTAWMLGGRPVALGREKDGFSPPDCGANSLYILLKLTGHSKSLVEMYRALPPPREDGYSMLELQRAARQCGLSLLGSYLTADNLPIRRPVIAHLGTRTAKGGHFVVLVPVGITGKMVQVIDPPYAPIICDYTKILSIYKDIRMLYPAAFWESDRIVYLLSLGLPLVSLLLVGLVLRRRSCRHMTTVGRAC